MEEKKIKAIQEWIGMQMATNDHVTSSLGRIERVINHNAEISAKTIKQLRRTDSTVLLMAVGYGSCLVIAAARITKLEKELKELKRMKGE